jgi:hypothetical protein
VATFVVHFFEAVDVDEGEHLLRPVGCQNSGRRSQHADVQAEPN